MRYKVYLKRSAIAVAIMAGLTQSAFADNSSGSVYGQAKAGSKVVIISQETGLTREVSVDQNGRFRFASLPTGKYKISAGGQTRDVQVNIGTGSAVQFNQDVNPDVHQDGTEVISVTGSRISAIDTSSVESTSVFTAEQLETLPIGRNLTAVALLAPGTVAGDTGFGNLASFGGASVAENGYYLNGFDITNARTLLNFATIPFDGIGQQQVKTGGYGAEYGRSLGGVINVVTKKGTNDWEFGAATYLTPAGLKASARDAYSIDPSLKTYQAFRSANTSSQSSLVFQGGGPLVQDKLFVYGLVEARNNKGTNYSAGNSGRITTSDKSTSPRYLLKLDWNINQNHILEFTGLRNKTEVEQLDYLKAEGIAYSATHGEVTNDRTFHSGGNVPIAKYTGIITEDFNISSTFGNLKNKIFTDPSLLPGWECPRVWDGRTNPALDYKGCWNTSQASIRDPNFGPNTDERTAFRLDAEYRLGDHTIRAGLDLDEWQSGVAGTLYTGVGHNNYYYRYYRTGARGGVVNNVSLPANTDYIRTWDAGSVSANYKVQNEAIYVEDSWQIEENWLLYAGLRSEGFSNTNADGVNFVESKRNLAPRLGFSWDINGDSSEKIFGTLGRYYIPVAANTNIRAAGIEWFDTRWWLHQGEIDAKTGAPVKLGPEIGSFIPSSRNAAHPETIAASNLDPMHQDELIIGYQREINDLWTGGVKFINRKVKDGMDDYCSKQPFVDWAKAQGYSKFNYNTLAPCVILNPGKDLNLKVDVNNDGKLADVVVPNSYLKLPTYQRTYNALEFTLNRASADGWYVQASYLLSRSKGNIEGYVNSTLEQDDPGLTQDFDHERFQLGTSGYLPNDRRHALKLFGGYDLTDEVSLSATLNVTSGRPVNCNGYVPLNDLGVDSSKLANYGASAFFCIDENGKSQPTNRGDYGRTPWTKDVGLTVRYIPSWASDKLELQANVFNLFNTQEVVKYNETGDYGRQDTRKNLNFLTPVNFQSPRSVSLSARYEF